MSTPEPGDYRYDVAISFLKEDLDIALQLHRQLAPTLSVFVYSHRQEELAGTDGIESFRETFRHHARLVVVLYREAWGTTNFTRIETTAITDRFFHEGPAFLLFLMLDDSPPPKWLPEHRIRFDWQTYGAAQAIGAIRLRIQELGGSVRPLSVADLARQAADAQAFAHETRALEGQVEGVDQVSAEATRLCDELEQVATGAQKAAPELNLVIGRDGHAVGVRTHVASVDVRWVCYYTNSLRDSFLSVRDMPGGIILPGERRHYLIQPIVHDEQTYHPQRVFGLGWCWSNGKQTVSSSELAEQTVRRLLERVQQAATRPDLR